MKSVTYFKLALVTPLIILWLLSRVPEDNTGVVTFISEIFFVTGWAPYVALYAWFFVWCKSKNIDAIQKVIDWLPFIYLLPLFIYFVTIIALLPSSSSTNEATVLESIHQAIGLVATTSLIALVVGYIFVIFINIVYSLLVNNGVIIDHKP